MAGRHLCAFLAVLLTASGANAFSLIGDFSAGAPLDAVFQAAPRWSSVTGLSDGIQVGVENNFAEDFGATPAEVPLVEQAVADAFAGWENDALQFDITFDAAGVTQDNTTGFEIDLFAVHDGHPVFAGNDAFGYADLTYSYFAARPLTNGQVYDGYGITGADIYINYEQTVLLANFFGLTDQEKLDGIMRLVAHEIGHAIGLGHPNGNNPLYTPERNYDTDTDPLNAMAIDPSDPWGDLIVSTNTDNQAVMSNRPCGVPFVAPCPAFYFSLQNDDLGGRDVLYPVLIPEPGTGALLALGLTGLVARRFGRRPRPARP